MTDILGMSNNTINQQSNESSIDRYDTSALKSRKISFNAELLILAVILLAGLLLRIGYLCEIVDAPDFSSPEMDANFHNYWARALITGDWTAPSGFSDPQISRSPYFRPPGYPHFLSLVYRLTSSSYLAIRIVQIAIGLVNCILAYILGKYLFRSSVGLIFAAFIGVYWEFIYFECELLAPVLLVFFALLMILFLCICIKKFTYTYVIAAGLFFGLFALTRPNILTCAPVILIWIWWIKRRRKEGLNFIIVALVFIPTVVFVIAPATLRNYFVSKDIVLVTSNAGINLYIGNNEKTDCVWPFVPILEGHEIVGVEGWSSFDNPKIAAGVEQIVGREMSHSQVSRFFAAKAVEHIKQNPLRTLKLIFKKALLFWGPYEISNNKEIYYERRNSAILRNIPGFPVIMSLSLIGFSMFFISFKAEKTKEQLFGLESQKQFYASCLIALFVLTYFASYLPFFVAVRYRLPLVPFILLFAAYGFYYLSVYLRQRQIRKIIIWLGIWCGLYILASIEFFTYTPNFIRWRYNRGVKYSSIGRSNEALWEYNQLLRVEPNEPYTNYNMGIIFSKQRKFDRALSHFERALQLKPNWTETYIEIGLIMLKLKKHKEAAGFFQKVIDVNPDSSEAHNNLGIAFLKQGKLDEAVTYYTKAIQLDPNHVKAHYNLGEILFNQGKTDEAINYYSQALQLDPKYVKALNSMGLALAVQDELDEAIANFQKAVSLEPEWSIARLNLCKVLVEKGRFELAIEHYKKMLQKDTGYVPAHFGLAMVMVKMGNYQQAIHYYEKVLQIDPNHVDAHVNLADLLAQEKRFDETVFHLLELIRLNPDYVEAHYNLANILFRQDDISGAIDHYQQVLRLDPGNKSARNRLEKAEMMLRKDE